jgi:hypothetical protein
MSADDEVIVRSAYVQNAGDTLPRYFRSVTHQETEKARLRGIRLDAIRIECRATTSDYGSPSLFQQLIDRCAHVSWAFFSDDRTPWLFLAHGPWLPSSDRGRLGASIWKMASSLGAAIKPALAELGPEVVIESASGIRHATTALIDENARPHCLAFLHSHWTALIVLSAADLSREDEIKALFSSAFPDLNGEPETMVSQCAFVASRCVDGDFMIVTDGDWESKSFSVDIVGVTEGGLLRAWERAQGAATKR